MKTFTLLAVSLLAVFAGSPSSSAATTSGFSYTEAVNAFKAGAVPTVAGMEGSWKMIGLAVPGTDPDQYDAAGIANSDGSLLDELKFQVQTDVLGGGTMLVLNVGNLGSSLSNQGPFTANISGAGLAFQTYGYTNNCLDESVSFPRVCKVVKASGALICHVDDSATDLDYSDEYDVYVRE